MMTAVNLVNERLSDIQKSIDRIGDTIKGLDARLRRVEYLVWTLLGALVAIGLILGLADSFLSHFSVTITPKP